MAKNLKAGQHKVRIGRRTGENVIPAKRVIGRATDGTEIFDDYWTDSASSGNDSDSTIASVRTESSKNETCNRLGRRTGVNALSGKLIKQREDGTEDYNDYWTEQESVTDASSLTHRSSLADTSKRTRPSSSTEASHRTRRSRLKRSDAYFSDPSISGEHNKIVHDKSCNTSGIIKDNLTSTTHAATEASHRSLSFVSPNKGTKRTSPGEISQKDIHSTSRSSKSKRRQIFQGSYREDVVGDDSEEDEMSHTGEKSVVRKTPQKHIVKPSISTKSKQTPDKSVREDNSDNVKEIASDSILKNRTLTPRHLTYSLHSSPRKCSQGNVSKNPATEENFYNGENEMALTSITNNKNAYRPNQSYKATVPNEGNNLSLSLPTKSCLRDPATPVKKKRLTFEEYDVTHESDISSTNIRNKNLTYSTRRASSETSKIKETSLIHSVRSSPRKSSQQNAPSSPKNTKYVASEDSASEDQNEMTSTSIRNENLTDCPPYASSKMSPSIAKSPTHSLRSSPRKSSQRSNFKASIPIRNREGLISVNSIGEEYDDMGENDVISPNKENTTNRPPYASSEMSQSKAKSSTHSLRSSPRKNSQRSNFKTSIPIRNREGLISVNSIGEEYDDMRENYVVSPNKENTTNRPPYASSEMSQSKAKSSTHSLRSSPRKSSQNSSIKTSIPIRNRKRLIFSVEEYDDMKENEVISPNINNNNTTYLPHHASSKTLLNEETSFHNSPKNSSHRNISSLSKTKKNTRKLISDDSASENEFDNNEMKITSTSIRNESTTNKNFQASVQHSPSNGSSLIHSSRRKNSQKNIKSSTESKMNRISENSKMNSSHRNISSLSKTPKNTKKLISDDSASESEFDNNKMNKITSTSIRNESTTKKNSQKNIKSLTKSKMSRISKNSKRNSSRRNISSLSNTKKNTKKLISDDSASENEFENNEMNKITSTSIRNESTTDKNFQVSVEHSPSNASSLIHPLCSSPRNNSQKNKSSTKSKMSSISENSKSEVDNIKNVSKHNNIKMKIITKNKNKLVIESTNEERKLYVAENVENDPDFEPEISIPRVKENADKSRSISKCKDMSMQRSSRKKSRLCEDLDSESDGIAAGEISLAGNETSGATASTSEHLPSKPTSKDKKLNSTNSSKRKRKMHSVENVDSNPENSEQELEAGDEEAEAPKHKKSKAKSKNARQDIPSDQLRRSTRDRVAPLKYWANERRLFSHDKGTGEIKYLGIDPGTGVDDECLKYLERRQEKMQQTKIQRKKARKRLSRTTVFNQRTGKEENVVLHMPFECMDWEFPHCNDGNEDDDTNAGYYLTKPFNTSNLTFGLLKICPKSMKPTQVSPNGSIYFLVVKGQVKTNICDTEREFKRLDCFIVPRHQTYSIENLKNSTAVLSFCAFKLPFFDYEVET